MSKKGRVWGGVAGVVLVLFFCFVGLVSYRGIAVVLYRIVSWIRQCFFRDTFLGRYRGSFEKSVIKFP